MSLSTPRYHFAAMVLHWTIAALIIANLALAWSFEVVPMMTRFTLYQWHKSLGISVLVFSLIRLALRFMVRPPQTNLSKGWQKGLAHAVHWGFYGLMITIPMSGWLVVSTSPINIPTLLFNWLPWPHLPVPAASREALLSLGQGLHYWLAYLMCALLALHVLAALKHQFIDRDGTLWRMLPTRRRHP